MANRTAIIDPTKNVLYLVAAQEKFRDALRASDLQLVEVQRTADKEAAEAETRRIDQLRAQDARYGSIMETMRNDKIDSTAKLLASQLQEIKGDIQVELRSLNQFRWESGGKTSGQSMIAYIIVQIILSVAGVASILIFFKPH